MNVRLSRVRRNQGFTLIELLVVITIIGILTAIAIPTFGVVQAMMKRTQAKSLCVSIGTAITQYNTEYSVYPVVSGMGSTSTDASLTSGTTGPWQKLCTGLNGNNKLSDATYDATTGINTRNIPYLTAARRDIDASGGIKDPVSLTGEYFNLKMDTDYNNVIVGVPDLSKDTGPDINISAGVAVWSSAAGTGKQKKWVSNY